MTTALAQVQPFVYTNPQGLKLEVLFVLDLDKKGYINATAIASAFGKQVAHWLRTNHVDEYIAELLRHMNQSKYANSHVSSKSVTYTDLVIVREGAPGNGGGTWLHPKLAVIFARWMSPHFAIWCDEQITELLRQNSRQQFPELSLILNMLEANQRQICEMEQRFEDHFNSTEKMLNHFREQLAQDSKNTLGGIYLNLNGIHKMLRQQQQIDLLQPPIQETLKQTLVDYQQVVEQMLRGHQDTLIHGYLVKIQENLERIAQRIPEPVVSSPLSDPLPVSASLPQVETGLVTEITALRVAGESWNHIAQNLNARSIATPSGKGKWYGSSVKRYAASQHPS